MSYFANVPTESQALHAPKAHIEISQVSITTN